MSEYKATKDSINALIKIADIKDRPLCLTNQLEDGEMREIAAMISHGYIDGAIIQAPPNHIHYLLHVQRIMERGTALLIEHMPRYREEVDAMIPSQLHEAARGRRGDPIPELAKSRLKEFEETDRKLQEAEKEANRLLTISQHNQEMSEARRANQLSERAVGISEDSNSIAKVANAVSDKSRRWAFWAVVLSAMALAWTIIAYFRDSGSTSEVEQLVERVRILEKHDDELRKRFLGATPAPAPAIPVLPAKSSP